MDSHTHHGQARRLPASSEFLLADPSTLVTETGGVLAAYRRQRLRRVMVVAGLAAACVVAFLLDLVTGPSSLTAGQVVGGLFNPDGLTPAQAAIVWQVRLPYALMALMVGAALSLAGAEMQTILNNAMASPFTLGVSSAAS